MPVNVAVAKDEAQKLGDGLGCDSQQRLDHTPVEYPWSRIVCSEADGDVVTSKTRRYHIALHLRKSFRNRPISMESEITHRIDVIVRRTPRAPHNVKRMLQSHGQHWERATRLATHAMQVEGML